jgi:hypothetical protein
MPRATVSTEPERFDLESLPEAWVLLRRMSYGERLHRQDMAMQMSMEADQRKKTARMDVTPAQTAVAQFELQICVIDHNLEDESGRKLNFSNQLDCAQLDGRVGEEIAELISTLHDWSNQLPNSGTRSENASGRTVLKQKVLEHVDHATKK